MNKHRSVVIRYYIIQLPTNILHDFVQGIQILDW
jgi:hypothetical protein